MIKIYTFFTDTHRIFLKRFLNTFPFEEDIDLQIRYIKQECESGSFMKDGWLRTMERKVQYVIDALEETKDNEWFMHVDVDVQFFGRIKDYVRFYTNQDFDFIAQNDYGGGYCAGLFACKRTDSTVNLWSQVKDNLPNHAQDQVAMNHYIKALNVKATKFDNRIYTYGSNWKKWDRDDISFIVPNNILMHHGNWTEGIDRKIQLMDLVRDKVNENN